MTTTNYEPGRIYSGIVGHRTPTRTHLMRGDIDAANFYWTDGQYFYDEDEVTDVRGPLVVLDMEGYSGELTAAALNDAGFRGLADQIEQQTRPPLQDGWHEVAETGFPKLWKDGIWWNTPQLKSPLDHFTSIHYIGPAGDDA